jgi:hypothetical protein
MKKCGRQLYWHIQRIRKALSTLEGRLQSYSSDYDFYGLRSSAAVGLSGVRCFLLLRDELNRPLPSIDSGANYFFKYTMSVAGIITS